MRDVSEKTPNPQGKGLVPVLSHLNHLQPSAEQNSRPYDVLMRYLFSRLVLRARFSFQPVRERRYTLYWHNNQAFLSMITPDEFGGDWPARAVADCRLCADLTWQCLHLYSADKLAYMAELSADAITIDPAASLQDTLPFCDGDLPFNQRALAYGMSHGVASQLQELTQLSIPALLSELGEAPIAISSMQASTFITDHRFITDQGVSHD